MFKRYNCKIIVISKLNNLRMIYIQIYKKLEQKESVIQTRTYKYSNDGKENVILMNISSLKIDENTSGIKLINHFGIPMFIFILRHITYKYFIKNKYKIFNLLRTRGYIKESIKKTKQGHDRQIFYKTKYTTKVL